MGEQFVCLCFFGTCTPQFGVDTHADPGEVDGRHLEHVVVLRVEEELGLAVEELRLVAADLLRPADTAGHDAVEQAVCRTRSKQ